jgi:hypothetical protein
MGGSGGLTTIQTLMRNLVQAANGVAAAISGLSPFATSQAANSFLAAPSTGAGLPTFRKITDADLPDTDISWRVVSASRAVGTTYTNTLPRRIKVLVDVTSSTYPCFLQVFVNGVNITNGTTAASETIGVAFEVPAGQTYSVALSSGTATGLNWSEL